RVVLDQAGQSLIWTLENESDVTTFEELAKRLSGVASRLESGKARQLQSAAGSLKQELHNRYTLDQVKKLLNLIERLEPGGGELVWLATELSKETGQLSPAKAAKKYPPAMDRLMLAADARSGFKRSVLEACVTIMMRALDHQAAAGYSKKLAFNLCSARDANDSGVQLVVGREITYDRTSNLDDFLTKGSQAELTRRAASVTVSIGLTASQPLSALSALPGVSQPLPCRLSTQDLVELLKMPTCFGKARQVVLK